MHTLFRALGDTRFHVVDVGVGDPTIVTIGGWAGSWEMWLGPLVELSRSHRVVAYDHRGTGETPLGDVDPTLPRLVDDLVLLLDDLGIERAILAGESQGASVAVQMALDHPDRIDGLLLVAGSATHPTLPPEIVEPTAAGLRDDNEATLRRIVEIGLPDDPDGHLRRWAFDILRRSTPDASARLLTALDGVDQTARLDEVAVPAVVVHGTLDWIVPLDNGRALADALPDAEFVPLEGAGHVPTMSRPDAVAAAARTLVERVAGTSLAAASAPPQH